MSSQMDVHIATLSLGALVGATELPLAKLPSMGGGITILEANLVGPSAGTSVGGLLVTMTNAGTPVLNGTVATFTTPGITAAGVPIAAAINNSGYVGPDYWIGFDQTSGTVPAGTFITLSYIMGKAP